ncbi:MAG: undecaprenyl/decaprenyl-phosphate alpha-N-acetylglucosaminyl 1-phosphate transferase [Actinobacteria bacterium]|nr:undecaprenyl/decaprenyl-phosphate alpha-N-acetylglucosaminyl 1-phosphate transferase [Actinomycetota bacterium]
MIPYLVVFGASAGVTFLATPLVRRLAIRFGAIDHPSDRKVHPRPTPTLGGVAIFLGVLAGLEITRLLPFFSDLRRTSSELLAVAIGAAAIVLLGVYDDVRGARVSTKVSGQVLAAGVMVLLGVQLLYLWLPGQGILSLGPDLAVPLTILWVLAMVNAVNLIDGLDGLAAGIVAIAAAAFFVYTFKDPSLFGAASSGATISAVAAGAAIGFLPWNFHPARNFMGDSGSMLLGLLLAAATIVGVGRNPFPPATGDFAVFAIPILVPLFVLAVPFLDVLLAILRRVRRRRPVTHADKEHVHHRLMDIGHSHRQAVLLLYLWSALISVSALAVGLIDGRLAVGVISAAAVTVIALTLLPRLRRRRRLRVVAAEDEHAA